MLVPLLTNAWATLALQLPVAPRRPCPPRRLRISGPALWDPTEQASQVLVGPYPCDIIGYYSTPDQVGGEGHQAAALQRYMHRLTCAPARRPSLRCVRAAWQRDPQE